MSGRYREGIGKVSRRYREGIGKVLSAVECCWEAVGKFTIMRTHDYEHSRLRNFASVKIHNYENKQRFQRRRTILALFRSAPKAVESGRIWSERAHLGGDQLRTKTKYIFKTRSY